jgi:hypothetical protein
MNIQITCGWCKKKLGSTEWEEYDDRLSSETHSICDACLEKLLDESNSISLVSQINKSNKA